MHSLFPAPAVPASQPVQPKATIESIRSRAAFMDPDLEHGTAAHEAAVLLVAASEIGQNIDRLARFTGFPRERVARRARRLIDNGVWQEGRTVASWRDNIEDVDSFRADVAVAEGTLCRRTDEFGGLEWAPSGYWRKHFEYVSPRAQELPQVICYHPHVEMPEPEILPRAGLEEEEEEEVAAPGGELAPARPVEATVPALPADAIWLGSTPVVPAPTSGVWSAGLAEAAEELFPDAHWLS